MMIMSMKCARLVTCNVKLAMKLRIIAQVVKVTEIKCHNVYVQHKNLKIITHLIVRPVIINALIIH